jgi:predicted metal-dependent peptidase
MVRAVRGAIARGARTRRPRPADVDWPRTVQANLGRWRPGRGLVVERWIGHGRRVRGLHDVVLCVDQSGSMATSVVHAAVAASVLSGLPAVRTRLAVFDTAVVDLTHALPDPVAVLFGAQLGGGTDLDVALAWCQTVVHRPAQTVVVLVSDLGHGGDPASFRARAAALFRSGVTGVVLLAITDDGRPSYDAEHAAFFASLGVPCLAVTPAELPDMLAVALRGGDVGRWVGGRRD